MAGRPSKVSVVKVREPELLLEALDFKIGKRADPNVLVSCPYAEGKHGSGEDRDPSCSVNLEEQVFNCKACGSKGTFIQLCAQQALGRDDEAAQLGIRRKYKDHLDQYSAKVLDPSRAELWHRALLSEPEALAKIMEKKGLTRETIERRVIGWDRGRYTIPMWNLHKDIVQCKRYSMDPNVTSNQKFRKTQGLPADVIYPMDVLDENEIVILTEGEIKALLLNQMGLPAVSGTKGAKGWEEDWNQLFVDKTVFIVYDTDTAGRAGASVVARSIYKYARSVAIVSLPFKNPDYNDVDDWFVREGHTLNEFRALLKAAEKWEPSKSWSEVITPEDEPLTLNSVAELQNSDHVHKHVAVRATLTGREDTVQQVPRRWMIHCDKDQVYCRSCPVYQMDQNTVELPRYHPELLKYVGVLEHIRDLRMKQTGDIPRMCDQHKVQVLDRVSFISGEIEAERNGREARTGETDNEIAGITIALDGDASSLRPGLTYHFKGFPAVDPVDQSARFLAYEAVADDFLSASHDAPVDDRLALFQPDEWTVAGIEARLSTIYDDLSTNVTHIYDVPDLHTAIDLSYHSVMGFNLGGEYLRGTIDALILGDTGTGKSTTADRLRAFYGLGDKAVGSGVTIPGLIGAIVQSSRKKWIIRWGKLPINDRKLVVIEECGTLSEDAFTALRDARSSGVAVIDKVKRSTADARTRLLWIGNPRGDFAVDSYSHGILAVRGLVPHEPDLRRFDYAYVISGRRFDAKAIAEVVMARREVEHEHTQELSRALLLWAWSRTPDDVSFDPDAYEACHQLGSALSEKYTSRIPLVGKDLYQKVARIAVACAVRTFSDDGHGAGQVRVRKCHVEWAVKWLDSIYTHEDCDYRGYSVAEFRREEIKDVDRIKRYLIGEEAPKTAAGISHCETLVRFLLESETLTSSQFAMAADVQWDDARKYMGEFVRANCLKPNPAVHDGYHLTSGFRNLLRTLLQDGVLTDMSSDEAFPDEEY